MKCTKRAHGPGPNGVRPVLLRNANTDPSTLLINLFSLYMSHVIFRHSGRTQKKGFFWRPWEILPINNTPILFRLMENAAKEQPVNYPNTHSLTIHWQHGFLRWQHCVPCQFSLLNLPTQDADTHQWMLMAFWDVKSIWLNFPFRLLVRIRACGMWNSLLLRLSSFLSDGFQFLDNSGYLSQPCAITIGVIQDSFFGPFLTSFVMAPHTSSELSIPLRLAYISLLLRLSKKA